MEAQKNKMCRVLVVEDDPDMAALLTHNLKLEGFVCDVAVSGAELTQRLERLAYDAVLLDLCLGDENGLELLPRILGMAPYAKVIVMTAFGSIDLAVDAMERGATTFLTKSDDPGKIVEQLKRRLHAAGSSGDKPLGSVTEELGIIGESAPMRQVLHQLGQLRDIDATILILGESGTGKELMARAVHMLSGRSQAPFEAINCGAIPENLLEAELFGSRKGAYTDAKADKSGIFEVCADGYVFLDEVGELPAHLQVKLLRVLQEREIKPLGANRSIKVNTRVIAATNRDLEAEVAAGRFRDDLFYRLSVVPITLPPLRERREDIPLLVSFYLDRFNQRYGRQVRYPHPSMMEKIINHPWPGNIRELQNFIERAILLSQGDTITWPEGLTSGKPRDLADSIVYAEAKERFEKAFLEKVLSAARGNISEAARISGRFRSDIYRLMEKYGIRQDTFKTP